MANHILVTPDGLRNRAKEIRGFKSAHHDIMVRLTNLMSSLSATWQGEAQDALLEEYMGKQQFFEKFEQAIESFAVLAETTASDMEAKDNEYASMIDRVS